MSANGSEQQPSYEFGCIIGRMEARVKGYVPPKELDELAASAFKQASLSLRIEEKAFISGYWRGYVSVLTELTDNEQAEKNKET